jgi:hypothetical protein
MSTQLKVLPGSSRVTLAFIVSHWRDLAKMSLIPLVIYLIGSVLQIKAMSGLYREMGSMMTGGQVSPEFMNTYLRSMATSMLFSILGMVALGLLFVEIVRYRKSGNAPWIALDGASLKAALMTIVYALGMMMLTMAAYMGVVIAFMIVAGILGAIMGAATGGEGTAFIIFMVLIVGVTFVVILGFLYWFMFRFLVGLPGVALGHSPDFFKDIWPLAKGEGFGLPSRVMLATLVFYLPFMVILGAGIIFGIASFPVEVFNQNNPDKMFPAIADLMDGMIYILPISMALFMPFMWFVSLLLAEAFDRFRVRNEGQTKRWK